MKRSFFFFVFLFLLLRADLLCAAVRLPALVGDKMVLQRDVELTLWGWADAGEEITVRFRGEHFYATTDRKGEWSVVLPAQSTGGPFVLEVNDKVLRDVLVGDVYLCSGQSNQETPITRLVEKFPEISVSNNHMIRHFKVPTQEVGSECDDLARGGVWYSAVASEVMNWTALSFFFASEVYRNQGVPVGVVVSSKGGSDIQSWMDKESLGRLYGSVASVPNVGESVAMDKGSGLWNGRYFDDSSWDTTQLPGTWDEAGFDVKGSIWYRKTFDLPSSMVGRHARIYMGRMSDQDSVFVNGRCVGTTAYFGPPRVYDVPAGLLVEGRNVVALKLTALNGHGEVVRDKPYKIKGDDDEVDLVGTWRYCVGLNLEDGVRSLRKNVGACGLYNGMICPLRRVKFKGVVWYQGETDTGRLADYAPMLEGLIWGWRNLFGEEDLPFLLVQLPNYMAERDGPTDSNWARLREAQAVVADKTPGCFLAVTYDTGEWNDIHPLNKKTPAERLYLGARRVVYGEDVPAASPVYKGMEIRGGEVVISFDNVGRGLVVRGDRLNHFAVAGSDGRFYWANAVLRGNKVVLSSDEVPDPVAVRYAWSDNPAKANLYSKDGLPVRPFRTDDW